MATGTAREGSARWESVCAHRSAPPRRWSAAAALGLVLAAGGASAAARPGEGAGEPVMRVHAIDVGEGTATLLELSCAAVLVDTGGERTPNAPFPAKVDSNRLLLRYLRAFFKDRPYLGGRLASLILTHPHSAQMRGLRPVLSEFRPRNVVWNGQPGANVWHLQNHLTEFAGVGNFVARQHEINATTGLTNGVVDPVVCSGVDPRIRLLWGQVETKGDWLDKDFRDQDNHSVALRVDFGAASVLITGDLEATLLPPNRAGIERLLETYEGTPLLDADLYLAGRNGAESGTSAELLARVSPKLALIEAGPACPRGGNTAFAHGHPSDTVVQLLERAVALNRPQPVEVTTFGGPKAPLQRKVTKAVYATSWDGNVVLEARTNGEWAVRATSAPPSCN